MVASQTWIFHFMETELEIDDISSDIHILENRNKPFYPTFHRRCARRVLSGKRLLISVNQYRLGGHHVRVKPLPVPRAHAKHNLVLEFIEIVKSGGERRAV